MYVLTELLYIEIYSITRLVCIPSGMKVSTSYPSVLTILYYIETHNIQIRLIEIIHIKPKYVFAEFYSVEIAFF